MSNIALELGVELNDATLETIGNMLVDDNNETKAFYVISGTGTGKSTLIPPSFLRFKMKRDGVEYPAKIVVTVPTRIAVASLYNTVRALFPSKGIPSRIGYAADNIIVNPDADLRYVTTEHFLRSMLRYYSGKEKTLCDILIVDEIHTGTIANEIILTLWLKLRDGKDKRSKRLGVPRLLLASANDVTVSIPNVQRGMVKSDPPYEITTVYSDVTYFLEKGSLYTDSGKQAYHYSQMDKGNILVFLPGRVEIDKAIKGFHLEGGQDPSCFVISVEGNISAEHANELAGRGAATGKTLVIFATNAAETSLTITNLGVVIDTLAEKIMYCAPDESPVLTTQFISKDSSLQRRGRTGRVREGIYHVMMKKEDYDRLRQGRDTEITRVPLSQYILLLKRNGLEGREILMRAGQTRLDASYRLVTDVGAFDEKGELSKRGIFCSKMPLSVRAASFMYDALNTRGIDIIMALTLCSIIENFDSNYYFYPSNVVRKEYYEERFSRFCVSGSENSLQGRLKAWNTVLSETLAHFNDVISTEACLRHMGVVSKKYSLAQHSNRDIYRTLLVLREKARFHNGNVDRRFPENIEVSDVIPDNIVELLSRSFPIYQIGEKGEKYYPQLSESLIPFNLFQRGNYRHECVAALSTIRLKIEDSFKDNISLFVPVPSIGTRANTGRARREFERRESSDNSFDGPSKSAPREQTVEEFLTETEKPEAAGYLTKKKDTVVRRDYLLYVSSLLILPPKTTYVPSSPGEKDAEMLMDHFLPVRAEESLKRKYPKGTIRENVYNILVDKNPCTIILDPNPLQMGPGMLFTSPYSEDVYLGALGKKEELPSEKMIFLLVGPPDDDMLNFLRARRQRAYISYSADDYSKRVEGFIALHEYDYFQGLAPPPLPKEPKKEKKRKWEKKEGGASGSISRSKKDGEKKDKKKSGKKDKKSIQSSTRPSSSRTTSSSSSSSPPRTTSSSSSSSSSSKPGPKTTSMWVQKKVAPVEETVSVPPNDVTLEEEEEPEYVPLNDVTLGGVTLEEEEEPEYVPLNDDDDIDI